MFANRFTALIDACSLVSALGRNTILSLAETELFRVRWSEEILDDTERALTRIFIEHGRDGSDALAATQVKRMRRAFPDAMVDGYEELKLDSEGSPDRDDVRDDVHVVAAARRCRASVLVTENVRHFPPHVLNTFGVEVRTSDDFIADTVDLDPLLAVCALARMRSRFQNP